MLLFMFLYRGPLRLQREVHGFSTCKERAKSETVDAHGCQPPDWPVTTSRMVRSYTAADRNGLAFAVFFRSCRFSDVHRVGSRKREPLQAPSPATRWRFPVARPAPQTPVLIRPSRSPTFARTPPGGPGGRFESRGTAGGNPAADASASSSIGRIRCRRAVTPARPCRASRCLPRPFSLLLPSFESTPCAVNLIVMLLHPNPDAARRFPE